MNMLEVCIILYLGWLLWKEKKKKLKKKHQLRQTKYKLEVGQALFSAHMKPEQFHHALQKTADYLKADTVFFCSVSEYLDKGQLFWINQGEDSVQEDPCQKAFIQKKTALKECLPFFLDVLQGKEEWVCFDPDILPKEAFGYRLLKKHLILNLMVLPIRNEYGSLRGLLGAWNLKHSFQDAQPLRQVSEIFAAALEQYTTFQNLAYMGQTDGLTGLKNRNRYFADLSGFAHGKFESLSCIYIDANGLHELNNQLGHDAGDDMLKCIAEAFCRHFPDSGIYRIGGDEFVVLCQDLPLQDVEHSIESARKDILEKEYEISVGVEYQDKDYDIQALVKNAEEAMRENKRLYYENNGRARQMRILECKADQMMVKYKDVEVFLEAMSFKFKGIYFVNIKEDTVRSLFIVPIFLTLLEEAGNKFSQMLRLYNNRYVLHEDYPALEPFYDFDHLKAQINMGLTLESYYRNTEGNWLRLKVLKLDAVSVTGGRDETIWIFEDVTSNGEQDGEGVFIQ